MLARMPVTVTSSNTSLDVVASAACSGAGIAEAKPAAASSHAARTVVREFEMDIRRSASGCPLPWVRFDLFTDYSPNKPVYVPIATRFVRNIGFFLPINPLSNSFVRVYCNPLPCQGGCIRIHCRSGGPVHKMFLIMIALVTGDRRRGRRIIARGLRRKARENQQFSLEVRRCAQHRCVASRRLRPRQAIPRAHPAVT